MARRWNTQRIDHIPWPPQHDQLRDYAAALRAGGLRVRLREEGIGERDANLARTIEAIAMELLSDVNIDEIAADVQMELENLAVEDVWERSGANAHGYLEPGDAAWEMFEEALQPFQDVGAKYAQLLMQEESRLYCQGILKGLYDFHKVHRRSSRTGQWMRRENFLG